MRLGHCYSTKFKHGRRPPYWIVISACWTTGDGALLVVWTCSQNSTLMRLVCSFELLRFKYFVDLALHLFLRRGGEGGGREGSRRMSSSSRSFVVWAVPTVALYELALDFPYVTSFRSDSDSRSSEVENPHFGHFTTCKLLQEECIKCFSEFFVLAY